VLADILNTEIDLEVLDTAENGDDLIDKIREYRPDLVIADYHLPKNHRMFVFRRIQHDFNIPILMIIGKEQVSDDFIFEAMKIGVYDYVKIANNTRVPQFRSISQEIVTKVRAVMDIKAHQVALQNRELLPGLTSRPAADKQPSCLVVIGGSTGGTKALETIVRGLSQKLSAAVLVAVHLPEKFTRSFTHRIRSLTALKVVEGRPGLRLESGKIIVAPGDKNMVVSRELGGREEYRIAFSEEPADAFDQPSVDLLMKSAARAAGTKTLGVILSGMGKDGTLGTKAILSKGGETIAQDEASSAIFGMAKSAIEKGYINKVLGLSQIPDYINRFAEYHRI
jgi:two-component system, chemotaxis family, protein-glutamate methylesterase/glutaminase